MKLFDKYNRLNITATVLTFVVGSCAFYFLLRYILINQLDESLQTEQQEVTIYVSAHNALPEIISTKGQYTSYAPVAATLPVSFGNVRGGKSKEEYLREIQFTIIAGGKNYLVKVDKPLEETEDLLKVIIAVTVAMIAVILLMGYIINRIVIRRLWQPFYDTIGKVQKYHLADQDALRLAQVDVDEFSLLNRSINEMMERIKRDYDALKNFTGQAAHEMQTPLAVIRTRLDVLMQNELLLEKNAAPITDIEKAVHRLSRLYQSLLLLTKVENRQFELNEEISLDSIVAAKCNEHTEMAEAINLDMKLSLQPTTILFHQHLAEIIVSNLYNNAIRYNKPGGRVEIVLADNVLSVSNTSDHQQLDSSKLFKRFYRDGVTEEGNGLGLSIVKQICDVAGYPVSYEYSDGVHTFRIVFVRGV